MAFAGSGILGIEFTSGQLRLVRGALSGGKLAVHDFAVEETLLPTPENLVQQLEELIKRKRAWSARAALALSGPGVVHRLVDLPSMPLQELGLVVEREMRVVGGIGEDVVFDWEVVKENDSGGLKQFQIFVAMAPRSQVSETLKIADQCHLELAVLTTAPIALLRALKYVQSDSQDMHAILYLAGRQGYLVGAENGIWSFYREFSSRISEKNAETLVDEAVREANRVLLYHRQRHREGRKLSFLLCGDAGLEGLQARLQSETGVQGEIVQPGADLDLSPLGERAGIFRDQIPSLIVPIGLVAAATGEPGINLAPKVRRKLLSGRRLRRAGIAIQESFIHRRVWVAAGVVLLIGIYFALVPLERRYEMRLQARQSLYRSWLPAIQASEETRVLREREALLAQALGSDRAAQPAWVGFFKVIGRLAPGDLIFHALSFEKDKAGDWLVTLKGEVVSPDTYAAQATFNRFYQGIKSSPYLTQIELLPLSVTSLKSEDSAKQTGERPPDQKANTTPSNATDGRKTQLQFELRGRMRRA